MVRMDEKTLANPVFPENQQNKQVILSEEDRNGQSVGKIKKPAASLEFPSIDSAKCVACGICVDYCPRGALSIQNGTAVLASEKCINCRICVKKCPEGAIYEAHSG